MSRPRILQIRRWIVPTAMVVAAVTFLALSIAQNRPQTRRVAAAGAAPAARMGIHFIFGDRLERPTDYSGTLTLSAGRVGEIIPWRFSGEDAVKSQNAWTLETRRSFGEAQPNNPVAIGAGFGGVQHVIPKGFTAVVDVPPTANAVVHTARGTYTFRLDALAGGHELTFEDGDVLVQAVAVPARLSPESAANAIAEHDYPTIAVTRDGAAWAAWQVYEPGGDRVLVAHSTAAGWSSPEPLTPAGQDIFHTAIAEDARGRIWVVWSQRQGEEWDLVARVLDGGAWSAPRKLTNANGPNFFHRLVRDRAGNLHLVWVAHLKTQSHVMWSKLAGDQWSAPVEISGPSAWMPAAAADADGNLYVAWDSYRNGNYDIYARRIGAGGQLGELMQVTTSPKFQAHASLAVDGAGRAWLAWDESGTNWGKDWSRQDMEQATTLYADRRPRVAVLENGKWVQPVADPMAAVSMRYNRYVEEPALACDGAGRIWMRLQVRDFSQTQRADGWGSGGQWEEYLTAYEGDHWRRAVAFPHSSNRPDGAFAMIPAAAGVWAVWADDNRVASFGGRGGLGGAKRVYDIQFARLDDASPVAQPVLEAFSDVPVRMFGGGRGPGRGGAAQAGRAGAAAAARGPATETPSHEPADVARIRAYRIPAAEGGQLRILRGDFHRHTEISGDGAGDGSIEDYFRYMIDAASMDIGIVSDHDEGGQEYTWWRTEKAADLYHVPGGYTPLFGYERSVPYPNGHRNVVFAERGVKMLPISPEEQRGQLNTGKVIYPWLRQNRGICMEHSTATDQGTDWRDNDPELEPLMEIYQGYHANYEYEGAPRAESADYKVSVHGQYRPLGFYWNALAKGYKLGTESSSDHIATHTSYTLVYSPSINRRDIVESMRKRHAYGATDNIVLDVRARDRQGKEWMMGDILQASASPVFHVSVEGTSRIQTVEIIKDGKFVYKTQPDAPTAQFDYTDNAAGSGAESWYYIRVIQMDRNMAWSSPIWVKYVQR